jgi:hypothetical protein
MDWELAGGLGGRIYTAVGRSVRIEPKKTRAADGSSSFSLGCPFATIDECVEPEDAGELLAEYLSCPKRAAAQRLFEALEIAAGLVGGPTDFDGLEPEDTVVHQVRVPIWAVQQFRAALAEARGEQVSQ